ncbi:hypothetical protein GGR56DRAFT_658249 [Xylariaceae sp. FL0804]|nr:hypothetical protein GGR56DRAFT_658249 [Xylariaceae sp. FL0804]
MSLVRATPSPGGLVLLDIVGLVAPVLGIPAEVDQRLDHLVEQKVLVRERRLLLPVGPGEGQRGEELLQYGGLWHSAPPSRLIGESDQPAHPSQGGPCEPAPLNNEETSVIGSRYQTAPLSWSSSWGTSSFSSSVSPYAAMYCEIVDAVWLSVSLRGL